MPGRKSSKPSWTARLSFKPDLSLKSLYDKLFLILFVVDIVLRALWLDKPNGSLIFDEWYYVNVARVILRLPQSLGGNGQPPYVNVPTGLDPNHEHPPLAKLLIALSMQLLGDNGYGWRVPSVIFGSIAVLVFYLLMKKTANYKWVPLIATFLFSFDTLIFVQSRIAILDIFSMTFMLIGFYWYFSGRTYLSALGMALATLAKMTGAAGFGIIIVVHIFRMVKKSPKDGIWDAFFSWFERYFIVFAASFLIILTVLDEFWTSFPRTYPTTFVFEHLKFIFEYSTGLVSPCPNGIISCPWQWLVNDIRIPYLLVNVQVTAGNVITKYDSVAFWGVMNPTILYLTIPALLYSSYNYFKKQDDFSLFMLVWFAATYLPYLPGAIIGHRVTYLFYMMPAIPAICGAVAHMIADQKPPRLVVIFYLAVVLFWFYQMFPFKAFPT